MIGVNHPLLAQPLASVQLLGLLFAVRRFAKGGSLTFVLHSHRG